MLRTLRKYNAGEWRSLSRRFLVSGGRPFPVLGFGKGAGFGPAFEFSVVYFCSLFYSLAPHLNFLNALPIRIPLQTARLSPPGGRPTRGDLLTCGLPARPERRKHASLNADHRGFLEQTSALTNHKKSHCSAVRTAVPGEEAEDTNVRGHLKGPRSGDRLEGLKRDIQGHSRWIWIGRQACPSVDCGFFDGAVARARGRKRTNRRRRRAARPHEQAAVWK